MKYTSRKLYTRKNHRKDTRLNTGVRMINNSILERSLSSFILRSGILRGFVRFINLGVLNILKGPAYLKNYKNFTTKKDDEYVR